MTAHAHSYRGRLREGACVEIGVEGEKIVSISGIPEDGTLPWVLPVLVDLQHNGAFGVYYNQIADAGAEALRKTARLLHRHGVGRCLATLTTYTHAGLKASAAFLNRTLNADRDLDRLFFGLFHEGVFISGADGWRGAHAAKWLRSPDYAAVAEIDELSGNRIRMVNVAPEEPGALEFIERAVAAGKIAALGHCGPDAQTVREAVRRGASMVTHFGNGAPPLIHRFRNPFWAFLDIPELRLGLICDGFHLPPEVVGAALKCKGRAGCIPVSDASGDCGLAPGEYVKFSGQPFVVERNGCIRLKDSEILSGAWFQLDRAVEFLVRERGMEFLEAWEQCSTVPATLIGEKLPGIRPGETADFVMARWRDGVVIEQSVHGGVARLDGPVCPTDV